MLQMCSGPKGYPVVWSSAERIRGYIRSFIEGLGSCESLPFVGGRGRRTQKAVRSICLLNHPWQQWLLAPLKIHTITETLPAPICLDQMQGGAAASREAPCGRRAPPPCRGPGDPACAVWDFQGNEAEAPCRGSVRIAAMAWHSHVWQLIV